MSERGSKTTENAWQRAERDPEVVRARKTLSDLLTARQKVTDRLADLEAERATIDVTDPLAVERIGKLETEIAAAKAVRARAEERIEEAEQEADAAFKVARQTGVALLRAEQIRVKDRAVCALAEVLAADAELSALEGQIGHLGGYGGESVGDRLVSLARDAVGNWKHQKEDYPHKFACLAHSGNSGTQDEGAG